MTNHEAIKEMSIQEMAAMFYIMLVPFMEAFNLTEEQRKQMKDSIVNFLSTERKKE